MAVKVVTLRLGAVAARMTLLAGVRVLFVSCITGGA